MSTSLNIETNYNGTKKNKAVPYINPNASEEELLAFSQNLINLTNQSYIATNRIDKIELGTLPAPPVNYILCDGDKQIVDGVVTVPLQLSKLSSNSISLTIKGDCMIKATKLPIVTSDDFNAQSYQFITQYSTNATFRGRTQISILFFEEPQVGKTYTGNFLLPASDTYAELSFKLVFNFIEEG